MRGFLKDLLELVKRDYDTTDLKDFEDTILKGCDFNRDGKINKKELTMILLALAKQGSEDWRACFVFVLYYWRDTVYLSIVFEVQM